MRGGSLKKLVQVGTFLGSDSSSMGLKLKGGERCILDLVSSDCMRVGMAGWLALLAKRREWRWIEEGFSRVASCLYPPVQGVKG